MNALELDKIISIIDKKLDILLDKMNDNDYLLLINKNRLLKRYDKIAYLADCLNYKTIYFLISKKQYNSISDFLDEEINKLQPSKTCSLL